MTSIWFPNNKYPPNTKNYLQCLLLGRTFSIREKGLVIFRDFSDSQRFDYLDVVLHKPVVSGKTSPPCHVNHG